jgi:hypothetical protein
MRFALLSAGLLALAMAGCGSSPGRVKGKLLDNGQPKTFPVSTYAVMFTLMGPNGEPDLNKSYTAVVEADGSFEVHASGGTLPPGTYQVTIQSPGKKGAALKATPPSARREIKSGDNNITLDIAHPET